MTDDHLRPLVLVVEGNSTVLDVLRFLLGRIGLIILDVADGFNLPLHIRLEGCHAQIGIRGLCSERWGLTVPSAPGRMFARRPASVGWGSRRPR